MEAGSAAEVGRSFGIEEVIPEERNRDRQAGTEQDLDQRGAEFRGDSLAVVGVFLEDPIRFVHILEEWVFEGS